MRVLFILVLAMFSTFAQANNVVEFFTRLEGKWELLKGTVYLYDTTGTTTELRVTKLSTTTTRTADTEWKFDETYCSLAPDQSEMCIDTIYFYKLISDKLLLVTSEGTTELIVVNPSKKELTFMIQNEISSSITICSFLNDNEMYQEGVSYNVDGTSTAQEIKIRKVEFYQSGSNHL